MGRLQYILDRAFTQAPQDFEEPELSRGWHRGLSARFRHSEILRLVHPQVKNWIQSREVYGEWPTHSRSLRMGGVPLAGGPASPVDPANKPQR